jgi:hypothetical protein
MALNKGLIAGAVVVGLSLCIGLGWWLARTHDRRDAELAKAERAVIEAAIAKAAETNRKTLEEARANDAKEQAASDARKQQYDAQYAKDRERLAQAQAQKVAFERLPRQQGLKYLQAREWQKLDGLVESLAASGQRAPDGQFELHLVTSGIASFFDVTETSDESLREALGAYLQARPESAFAQILPAMQLHSAAWRARGNGYASEVTAEGWRLFGERNRQAWKRMMAVRSRSSSLPTWYEESIAIGIDAGIDRAELRGLFDEGIERFPGYHGIYFAYLRTLSPRWGGNYAAADVFVREQVAASTNPHGEMLYTNLYWNLDRKEGGDLSFFKDSRVDWSRMRTGFEALLEKYPDKMNRASFAAYACRAGDGRTYLKLRKEVEQLDFSNVAPSGVSLETCDARFLTEA